MQTDWLPDCNNAIINGAIQRCSRFSVQRYRPGWITATCTLPLSTKIHLWDPETLKLILISVDTGPRQLSQDQSQKFRSQPKFRSRSRRLLISSRIHLSPCSWQQTQSESCQKSTHDTVHWTGPVRQSCSLITGTYRASAAAVLHLQKPVAGGLSDQPGHLTRSFRQAGSRQYLWLRDCYISLAKSDWRKSE